MTFVIPLEFVQVLYLWWWSPCTSPRLLHWPGPPRPCPEGGSARQEVPPPRKPSTFRPHKRCTGPKTQEIWGVRVKEGNRRTDRRTHLSAIMAAAASRRTFGEECVSLRRSSGMPSQARAGTGSNREQQLSVERRSTCTSTSSSFSSCIFSMSLGTRLRSAREPAGSRLRWLSTRWTFWRQEMELSSRSLESGSRRVDDSRACLQETQCDLTSCLCNTATPTSSTAAVVVASKWLPGYPLL